MARRFFLRLLTAAAPAGDHVPDAELLRRFTHSRDPAAFELLVRRHADAVWSAARRVLRNDADAEDAFQAAFLVLARKAGSVRGACVGGWLHRVAVNAALKLRAVRAGSVSDGREPPSPSLTLPARTELESAELAAVVHQELSRLPDRYRLPVVLCDLEGHTHAEAAKVLGWPVGSVSGRLSRAHGLLRDRLTRRGLAPVVGLYACAAPAGVVHAAAAAVAGSAAVSPAVTSLAEGVLTAMRTAKLKLTAAVAAGLIGLAGAGTMIGLAQVPDPRAPGEPAQKTPEKPAELPKRVTDLGPDFTAFPDLKLPALPPPVLGDDGVAKGDRMVDFDREYAKLCPRIYGGTPVAIDPTDDTYRRLLKARIEQGRLEVIAVRDIMRVGRWTMNDYASLMQCLDDMRAAVTELWANDPKSLVPWLEEFVILAKQWESFSKARVEAGTEPPHSLNAARRYRLRVEAALWKAKNTPADRR